MKISKILRARFLILAIFIGGILYLLALQWLPTDGTYFSGDAGLKAIVSKNLASGQLVFDLNLPGPDWIKELWGKGLFSYSEPFVYLINGKYFMTFPYTFSLVTAPFYAGFGYRGFYIVPIFSIIFIWLVFLWICKKLNISSGGTAVGLLLLIFSTNLPQYSAIYGEHSLSACLAFAGFALMLPGGENRKLRFKTAIGAGFLTGFAVWFRPEQIFLVIFLAFLSSIQSLENLPVIKHFFQRFGLKDFSAFVGRNGRVYIISSLITMLLYGVTNWVIYQNFFGVHAIQVLERQGIRDRIMTFVRNLIDLTVGDYSFFVYSPIALLFIGLFVDIWIKKAKGQGILNLRIWGSFCLLFIMGVAALVPDGAGGKQWGPRFLLLLVPIVVLLFAVAMDSHPEKPEFKISYNTPLVFGLTVVIGLFGFVQNGYFGNKYLRSTYSQVEQAIYDLRADKNSIKVIYDPYLTQVFQPALNRDSTFIRVTHPSELTWLSQVMLRQNADRFTYICYSFQCELFDPVLYRGPGEFEREGYIYLVSTIKQDGKYTILDVKVRQND